MLRVEAVLNNGNTLVGYSNLDRFSFFELFKQDHNGDKLLVLKHDLEASASYVIINLAYSVNLFVSEISSDDQPTH